MKGFCLRLSAARGSGFEPCCGASPALSFFVNHMELLTFLRRRKRLTVKAMKSSYFLNTTQEADGSSNPTDLGHHEAFDRQVVVRIVCTFRGSLWPAPPQRPTTSSPEARAARPSC